MKTVRKNSVMGSVYLAGLSALLLSGTASALDPHIEKAVKQGKEIFTNETFGGNGKVCQSCHLDGGMEPGKLPNGVAVPRLTNAATIFPRYRASDNRVITLSDQIMSCVAGGLQGKPPAYGREELNSLVSYVTSLSQGKKMNMGGKLK